MTGGAVSNKQNPRFFSLPGLESLSSCWTVELDVLFIFFLLFSCVLDLLLNSRVYKIAVAWSNGKAW